MSNLLAPAAADVNLVAFLIFFESTEWALILAAATVIAFVWIYLNLAVNNLCYVHWTACFYLTFCTSAALGVVDHRNALANNTKVIQVRFYAVVWTAAYSNFEFMRQCYAVVAHIEALMNLFAEVEGI